MKTSENLFGFEQIEVSSKINSTFIFEEIRKEGEEYLLEFSTFYRHCLRKFKRNFMNYLTATATRNVFLEQNI